MSTYQQSIPVEYDLPFALADIFGAAQNEMTHQHMINLSSVYRIHGELDIEIFLESISDLFKRQEALRTAIASSAEGSKPQCRVLESKMPDVQVFDRSKISGENFLDESRELASSIALARFSFGNECLSRAFLIVLPKNNFIAGIITHHLISDRYSHTIIWKELMTLYSYRRHGTQYPPPHSAQYRDYVRERLTWQQGWRSSKELEYWTTQMDEFSRQSPELGIAKPKSTLLPNSTFELYSKNDPPFADLARRYRATPAMLLLAYFVMAHACWNKADAVSLRVIRDERALLRYTKLVGFLSYGRPLTINVSGNPTFQEIVARTKVACVGMFEHPWTPDEVLMQGRNFPSTCLFNFINGENTLDRFCDLEVEGFSLNTKPIISSRNIFAFVYHSDKILGVTNCRSEYVFHARMILENMKMLMQFSLKTPNLQLDELTKLLRSVGMNRCCAF